ncbi:MAG: 1-acyl-sn-glycerol-3-phosphate acyltransferase [Frankiales bacterium]|nr:1-acyl-sn-glycerol-3-phosphate acyltransferase [Frankiales bacterium]
MAGRRWEQPGGYLRLCVVTLLPLLQVLLPKRWFGLTRLPRHGPAILAVNHISYVDPLVIGRFVWDAGRNPRFLAKASLFSIPLIGRVFVGTGQIPVRRGTTDADAALRGAVEALSRGEVVIIYPEGTVTRQPDFWPMQAKTGVARLALLAPDVPVIPVGQWGAQEFLNVYARRFRPVPRKHVSISAGAPVQLAEFAGRPASAEVLREMTDRIMWAVTAQVAGLRTGEPPAEFVRYVRGDPRSPEADGGAEPKVAG